MEIKMIRSITFDNSFNDTIRREKPQPVNSKELISTLEALGVNGAPILLFVAGARPEGKPESFTLHRVNKLLAFTSKAFLAAEKVRLAEQEKATAQAARTARLESIKGVLRAERLTEETDFDRKYKKVTDKQAEIVESEIAEKAAAILEKEEQE